MNASPNRRAPFASRNSEIKSSMPSQRLILGTGPEILPAISAASIGLDLKSQADATAVSRALGVLKTIPDLELLLRRAESASRGFALSKDPYFIQQHREASEGIRRLSTI